MLMHTYIYEYALVFALIYIYVYIYFLGLFMYVVGYYERVLENYLLLVLFGWLVWLDGCYLLVCFCLIHLVRF